MLIGSHVSISKGLIGAAEEAFSYGANTFMVYTGAPQNTVRKPVSELKTDEGLAFMTEHGIEDIVVHAPYIINLASYKDDTFTLAKDFLHKEAQRAAAFGSRYLVVHPGAYTDKTAEYGINRIAEGINEVISRGMPDILYVLKPWPEKEARSEGILMSLGGLSILSIKRNIWAYALTPAMSTTAVTT